MARHFLADSERYALYGADASEFLKALGRISKRDLSFVDRGVADFLKTIAATEKVAAPYRQNGPQIAAALAEHYRTIISSQFLDVHSASNHAVVAKLEAAGTDMRALYCVSVFIGEAFRDEIDRRWWWRRLHAANEMAALQRLCMLDAASALTYERDRLSAETQSRRERLQAQLIDFRSVVEGVSGELGHATTSVDEALAIVSSAAGEALSRSRLAADATSHGNRNLTSSAASTEQLASSINELTRRSELSRGVVARVERAVDSAKSAIGDLEGSANTIGSIVDLISQIAEQTNLLSLNATIEAARAGEAGRGFAVVAQEVKTLASQTTKATQDIVEQISAVQNATARSVTEIAAISGVMEDLSRNASEMAVAISQQNSLTSELSRNLHETVAQVVSASEDYRTAAGLIESAGSETARLREAVGALSRIGGELVGDVDAFAERIKAA